MIIAAGSIGQSMFHPPVAGMISTYSGRNFSFSMSIFNMGGTFAFAVGPILITSIVRAYGLKAGVYSILIGLPLMVYLFKAVPVPEGENLVSRGFAGSIREALGDAWKGVILVWMIMVLRAFISQAWITFTPVLYAREGATLTSIGGVVSLFTLAGALSGLVAGHLADRIGYKPIFYTSHLLTAPVLLLTVFSHGVWIYPSAFIAGFVTLSTLPLGVSLGQELAPKGKSMVSSLMMGLALGVGGMMSPLVGKLADIYTIRTVLCWLAIAPLITTALVAFLPDPKPAFTRS
jgi:FSR family fosmidomycin resistance protein-like MFS transporter